MRYTNCPTGKRSYANRIEAMCKLDQLGRKKRPERDYYECKHCGKWHLTSQHRSTIGMTWDGVEVEAEFTVRV